MLTRIISGAVGVAIMAVVFFFHDTLLLPIAVAAMIGVMLFELLRAVKLEKVFPVFMAVELCGVAMPFLYQFFCESEDIACCGDDTYQDIIYHGEVSVIAFAVTLAAAFVVFVTWLRRHKELRYEQIFFALASMVLVPQAMSTMVRIDRMDSENGLFLLIMGLCGAWIADTGAYFTGVAFGKHKLCPEISPKKTIEGFVGGILTTGIVFAAAFLIYGKAGASSGLLGSNYIGTAVFAFIIGAVCAVIGTVGDLSASMVKRQIGFKDYGKIMPGHGGLMDRFDSVLFVLPTFYAMISLLDVISKQ